MIKPMTRAVMISPNGAVVKSLESAIRSTELAKYNPADYSVQVVTWAQIDVPDHVEVCVVDRIPPSRFLALITKHIDRVYSKSMILRNLLRFTPLDESSRFWAGVRQNPEAFEAVRSADVLVAVEREAVMTVWKAAHARGRRPHKAVIGLVAGVAYLEESHIRRVARNSN